MYALESPSWGLPVSCCGEQTMSGLGRLDLLLVWFAARPCHVWRLLATGWYHLVMEADCRTPVAPRVTTGWLLDGFGVWKIHGSSPLTGRLCQVLGLVLHCWQAAQCPETCLQGPAVVLSLCWPASGQGRPQIFPGHDLACWGQDESTGCMI